jgi:hypothetical protein
VRHSSTATISEGEISEAFSDGLALLQACERHGGIEGIVSKRIASP